MKRTDEHSVTSSKFVCLFAFGSDAGGGGRGYFVFHTSKLFLKKLKMGPLTETITSLLLTTAKNSERGWQGGWGWGEKGSLARRQSRSYYRLTGERVAESRASG